MNRSNGGFSEPISKEPGSSDQALVALLVELSEPARAATADEREAVERALAVLEARGAGAQTPTLRAPSPGGAVSEARGAVARTPARAGRRAPGVFVGLAVAAAVALAVLPRHQPAPDRAVEPLASAAHAALASLALAPAPSDRVREVVPGPPRRGGQP